MNRHLKAARTGFRAVADGVGFEIARQLIADTDIPLAQISAMLDFSEPAAFTRAFHHWSGETPSDYRAKHKPALV
jgi:AraC-like DNA-binding protein